MVTIKSFSVGNGDLFYIDHISDSFTIIDCNYKDDEQRDRVFGQLKGYAARKGVVRFISTHPDEDHIHGLDVLDDMLHFVNFYVVKNEAIRFGEDTPAFNRYCELRDGKDAFYVYKGCKRKWLNQNSDSNDNRNRGNSGIQFLWPDTNDHVFQEALTKTSYGLGINNISPIFIYSQSNGITAMWMGDMETTFLDKIKKKIIWPEVDVLFAPHHGRKSGHVSADVLEKLAPKVIVIGEAPSKDLDYYSHYNTIKQNSAGDITFRAETGVVRVYVENYNYSYKIPEFYNDGSSNTVDGKYLGSFTPHAAE